MHYVVQTSLEHLGCTDIYITFEPDSTADKEQNPLSDDTSAHYTQLRNKRKIQNANEMQKKGSDVDFGVELKEDRYERAQT
jgi:hypothetical protein